MVLGLDLAVILTLEHAPLGSLVTLVTKILHEVALLLEGLMVFATTVKGCFEAVEQIAKRFVPLIESESHAVPTLQISCRTSTLVLDPDTGA